MTNPCVKSLVKIYPKTTTSDPHARIKYKKSVIPTLPVVLVSFFASTFALSLIGFQVDEG